MYVGIKGMTHPGIYMKKEMGEAQAVFARAVMQDVKPVKIPSAMYTFARGSSDTVANILSYAFMGRLGIPVTSLPPSIFSIGQGVVLKDAMGLVISQSGASDDLIACAKGMGQFLAIINVEHSPVREHALATINVHAGIERAIPATKSVVGSIAAGMALLAAFDKDYRAECLHAARQFSRGLPDLPNAGDIAGTLGSARNIYVIGRRTSFGVAQEVALKLKETCALHAEAFSASEVLHGPLQLSTIPLTVLSFHSGDEADTPSLDAAEARFEEEGASVIRIDPNQFGLNALSAPAKAAALLCLMYPVIYSVSLQLGLDPDKPKTLMKVTRTQ